MGERDKGSDHPSSKADGNITRCSVIHVVTAMVNGCRSRFVRLGFNELGFKISGLSFFLCFNPERRYI